LGGAIFTIIGAVAQLVRDIIAERVKAGLRRALERGKRLGRPRARVDHEKLSTLKSQGLSQRDMADRLGVSHATVGRALRHGSKTV
jgi:DNA invertase Pin-like site-specific DNA recombinase